tara:strand:+ start:105 stop:254 length:150 start_codon:yes stop_codon:yes gene_type:complete
MKNLTEEIKKLAYNNPNDMDFGKAVRALLNKESEDCECARDESGKCKCQ